MNKDKEMARKIAVEVKKYGGETYYVGGCVRDKFLNKENKDIDIEIHGITPDRLDEILNELGKKNEMGASFGIWSLNGYGLDIAMPRTEKATGRGHKAFKTFTDPFIGPQKAAKRRDFTMNALMENVLTGEILDFYNGIEDIKNKVIRHVNDDSYPEDPLRVLRAAQFAARMNFSIAPETMELSKHIDLSSLSSQRVLDEMSKALLQAEKPSIFFEVLYELNQLEYWFSQISALKKVEQNPVFHKEGNVWIHTMMVLDYAAVLRSQSVYPLAFMLSALTHDLGKIVTTETIDGVIHAYKHELFGVEVADEFLSKITNNKKIKKYVGNMVLMHMKPNILAKCNSKIKVTNKMFDDSIEPWDLLLLAKADCMGQLPQPEYAQTEAFLKKRYKLFKKIMSQPFVTGKDLINAGIEPGENFSELMTFAHKLRLAGTKKENALAQVLALAKKQKSQI